MNRQLTDNFSKNEFLYSHFYSEELQVKVIEEFEKDSQNYARMKELADNLQVLRTALGCPININIAYRPKFWELRQGRSGNSQHTKAWAADIVADMFSPNEVATAIENLIKEGRMKQGGLGRYRSFTHYDLFNPDEDGRRWDNR